MLPSSFFVIYSWIGIQFAFISHAPHMHYLQVVLAFVIWSVALYDYIYELSILSIYSGLFSCYFGNAKQPDSCLAGVLSWINFCSVVFLILFTLCLGGQAKTLMFVHINPEVNAFGETISTLKFAERVASIELGAARSNKETGEIRELKEEVYFFCRSFFIPIPNLFPLF